eukprot:Phypoly_transcript_14349.p1 GENE.Phypoly_transcript_14349~~Phypoly_transcript_14349.p1  ORF type:complete len:279 (+),score=30.42 Phypoly_transcript_14349:75-911(+)
METLLQIIEDAENNRIEKVHDGDSGVYHINLARDEEFARSGMPFFGPDAMYENLRAHGQEPVFPPMEDLPRNGHVSFDVHYYVAHSSNQVHRITITRAHNSEIKFTKACFVDGDLIYLSGGGKGKLKIYLFNSHERSCGAMEGNMPRFWFYLEHQRIDVVADAYFSFEKKIWQGNTPRSPTHYGIFVNDQSTINRNSTLSQHKIQFRHYWPTILSFLFLFPLWVAWQFLDGIFILPVQQIRTHCQVRSYWIREKGGWMAQSEIGANLKSANEATRLLG